MGGDGGGGGFANTTHIATFTPDSSLGFSSLKVRTNWKEKKKCTQESKIGPKTNTQTNKNQFMVRLQAEILSKTTLRKANQEQKSKPKLFIFVPSR